MKAVSCLAAARVVREEFVEAVLDQVAYAAPEHRIGEQLTLAHIHRQTPEMVHVQSPSDHSESVMARPACAMATRTC